MASLQMKAPESVSPVSWVDMGLEERNELQRPQLGGKTLPGSDHRRHKGTKVRGSWQVEGELITTGGFPQALPGSPPFLVL